MPEHAHHQPLNQGFTLVELIVGAAISALIALVTAGLFKAGIVSYLYSYRQTTALAAARSALSGDGAKTGLIWEAQESNYVQALHASTLTLTSPYNGTVSFYVDDGSFYRVAGSSASVLATGVASLALSYYNLDGSGGIIVSTVAASATLVTAKLTVSKSGVNDKDRVFYAGAKLRNHP